MSQHAAHDNRRAQLRDSLPLIGDDFSEQAAPRPVLDPAATGSFQRIEVGQGATVENRSNVGKISPDSTASWRRTGLGSEMRLQGAHAPRVAHRETKHHSDRRFVVLIILLAGILCGAGAYLVHGLLGVHKPQGSSNTEQVQAAANQTIEYRGTAYAVRQTDTGSYEVSSRPVDADQDAATTLFSLAGNPVQLVLYNGAIIIPENLADGTWDVVAYTMGAGGLPTKVVDSQGNPVSGQGKITKVSLEAPNLVITDEQGTSVAIALS